MNAVPREARSLVALCFRSLAVPGLAALASVAQGPIPGGALFILDDTILGKLRQEVGFQNGLTICRDGNGTSLFLTGRMVDGTTTVGILRADGLKADRLPLSRPRGVGS